MTDADALLHALNRVEWKAAIVDDHADTWGNLAGLAPDADEDPDAAIALRALAEVCGMTLRPDRWDEPYERLYDFDGRRAYVPESFTPIALELFERLLPEAEVAWLEARLCDVLFIRAQKPDRYGKAKRAAEKLAAIGLSAPPTLSESQQWRRAAEIAARFNFTDVRNMLSEAGVAAIRAATDSSVLQFLPHLRTSGLCVDHASEIADVLKAVAGKESVPHLRRELLHETRRWTADPAAASAVTESIGDSWWEEAHSRSDSALISRSFLGSAFNAYNSVPRRYRSAQTKTRLYELPKLMREAGEASLDEMRPIRVGPPNLSSLQEWVEKLQAIDDPLEALANWVMLAPLETFEHAVTSAKDAAKASPFLAMLPMTTIADDGRKVHSTTFRERRGLDEKIWEQMFRAYNIGVTIAVRGVIGPGLANFSTHLKLSVADFELFCRASPFVPSAQRHLFATALHHGYYGRFAESLFMLAPLIESCVRSALRAADVVTRVTRPDDTEVEPGLSTLMDADEADDVFHADVAWNIRALFCGPLGPNLRNHVAHGLVTSGGAESYASVYAWWFAFRLAFVPFFNAIQEATRDDE